MKLCNAQEREKGENIMVFFKQTFLLKMLEKNMYEEWLLSFFILTASFPCLLIKGVAMVT